MYLHSICQYFCLDACRSLFTSTASEYLRGFSLRETLFQHHLVMYLRVVQRDVIDKSTYNFCNNQIQYPCSFCWVGDIYQLNINLFHMILVSVGREAFSPLFISSSHAEKCVILLSRWIVLSWKEETWKRRSNRTLQTHTPSVFIVLCPAPVRHVQRSAVSVRLETLMPYRSPGK